MGLEGNKGYSRQAYEDTEEEIKNVVSSVDASAPIEDIREKFAEQKSLMGEKESLHNEAWDQAITENTARDETKALETQSAAEQTEATELLKKMHENAGTRQEAVVVAPSAEKKQEKPVIKETTLSPEQIEQQEMQKLYEDLDLSRRGKDKDGFYGVGSRGSIEKDGGSIRQKLKAGLSGEIYNDGQKREKFFKGAMLTAGAGVAVGFGGATFLGTTAAILGFGTGGLAIGVGALGWAGMKMYHAYKERKHEKAFDKLIDGY